MRSMKLLRSACMLAVACGLMTTAGALAQTRDKPASSQAGKATTRAKTKANPDAHQQRRHAKDRHARHGKKKSRPVAAGKSAPRKAVATAARAPSRKPAARPLPPPVAWVPPPLGPERFYPHGIPELRPEFMHPEAPPARVEQAAGSRPESLGGQPAEWLP